MLPEQYNAAEDFLGKNGGSGRGRRPAYLYEGGELSFDDVLDLAPRVATLLRGAGADQEQRVAILLDDSPELVVAFWGALWAGCVAVPINTACTDEEVRYMLRDSRARVFITTRPGSARITGEPLPHLRRILFADGDVPLLAHAARTPPHTTPARTHRDEAAFWLYTSGSTGSPKGVIHAHRDMATCAESYGRGTLGLREDDVSFSVAKVPFAYGLGATLYMPMWVGASSILSTASNVFDIASVIAKYSPTVLWAIPSVYVGLLSAREISKFEPGALRLCVSAAEKLPERVFHAFKARWGLDIIEGIGTTEFLHIFLSNRPGDCEPGTCGRPVPDYSVRVVDEHGRELSPGQVGDLEVRGPSLMLGYWNRRDESRSRVFGGAMRTGDKCAADEAGRIRVMGRADDLFKVSGQWVVPHEVEAVVAEHPNVHECVIVLESEPGSDLPTLGAYVTLRPGVERSPDLENQIRSYAKNALLHFKAPRRVHVVDALPRTPTGKVDRRTLTESIAEGPGAPERREEVDQEVSSP